ncbi:MAG TPA: aminotransferase class V-fold PLP-dependent enzyme [Polyangiaceae bacterium]
MIGADLRVPLVTGGEVRYVNLDYASTAPCLEEVRATIDGVLPWYGSVHRGAGFTSGVTSRAYAAARRQVATFVGARPSDRVIFTRNTTDALNLLAGALPSGTEVISFASEHHANMLPWRRSAAHTQLPVPRSRDEALSLAAEALRKSDARHRLLAVCGASNVTGEIWPVAELSALARAHGARIAVDAAQLAPHRRVDMDGDSLDYVALSGHKLYAPFGAGALIGRSDWLDAARPYLAGGGAVKRVGLEEVDWAFGEARHEAGTPNVVGAIALGAACRALSQIGYDVIADHEGQLLDELTRGLEGLAGVEILSMWGPASPRIGLVTFKARGWHPGALAAALAAEHGVGVRDGAFCAHPLLEALALETSDPPGAVRASFGLGSREADVERLLCALDSLIRDGAQWRYRVEEGRHVPDPDPRLTALAMKGNDLPSAPACAMENATTESP